MILQSRLHNVKAINIPTACWRSEATVVRVMMNCCRILLPVSIERLRRETSLRGGGGC